MFLFSKFLTFWSICANLISGSVYTILSESSQIIRNIQCIILLSINWQLSSTSTPRVLFSLLVHETYRFGFSGRGMVIVIFRDGALFPTVVHRRLGGQEFGVMSGTSSLGTQHYSPLPEYLCFSICWMMMSYYQMVGEELPVINTLSTMKFEQIGAKLRTPNTVSFRSPTYRRQLQQIWCWV